ncbi:concanavalin A-like lectin/glucanase domain-containing protein [Sporodiniella umbellata]|nr:concanavalin A-like lectin/glucanase domain-containing protein [Sporodiniella umbellata]
MLKSVLASILAANLLFSSNVHGWSLKKTYKGASFFDNFSFWTDADPTHGFVKYVDQGTAKSSGLIYNQGDKVFMKADNTTKSPGGRKSVRITSHDSFSDSALVLLDLEHMPIGCGTWPAFWMVGPNWPNSGEIDIIENVNKATLNQVTLHTNAGCTMAGAQRTQTGKTLTENCDVKASGQGANVGCGVLANDPNSYGDGLNKINGGVYATRMTKETGIQVWFFPRNKIPGDLNGSAPNPDGWPTPIASFPFKSGSCTIDHFSKLQVVFDLTFCGDWAGGVYGQSGCPSNCNDFVANNPGEFSNAFWSINYVKVFQ